MLASKDIVHHLKGDKFIWLLLLLLTAGSLMVVYSATASMAFQSYGGPTSTFLIKHFLIMAVALSATYVVSLLPYQVFLRLAPYLLLIAVPLLLITLMVGVEVSSARRWLAVPFTELRIQPSEFAKLALIIYVARAISHRQDRIKEFKYGLLPVILPIILVCTLIAPADLSTAGILFMTCFAMMFVGRIPMRYIGLLVLFALLAFGALIILGYFFPESVRTTTWISRIQEFMGVSGDDYQITQSKIAIANGSLIGQGLGNSIQRNFLPSPYTDFIYAIICEEWGLIGGIGVIAVYVFLLVRCAGIVTKCRMAFGSLLVMGLCFLLVIQAFANIAVSVDLIPVTGLTLPLVSKGGSSLIFACIAFGIILSVSKNIQDTASFPPPETVSDASDT